MDGSLTPTEARRQLLQFLDEVKKGAPAGSRRGESIAVMIDLARHQRLAELARISEDPQLLALIGPAQPEACTGRAARLKKTFGLKLAGFRTIFKARVN